MMKTPIIKLALFVILIGTSCLDMKTQDYSVYKSFEEMVDAQDSQLIEVKAITKGPKFHWFSFYDLHQFDPTNRYALGMEVDFEGRSPTSEDTIKIGIIDLENDCKWTEIGSTTAWSWQLGCRLQWLPGSSDEVLWNERKDNHYVCRIYNVKTGESRILPRPVYSVSPDGQKAYTYDFERVGFRGYGYDGVEAAYKYKAAPEETGVYLLDMNTGESELIISLARISALREPDPYPAEKYLSLIHI